MKNNEFTGVRDWRLRDIHEGDIITTQQGSRFVVCWNELHNQWCLVQSNNGSTPDYMGDWFELKKYMQPNLEIIGSIYSTPELMSKN